MKNTLQGINSRLNEADEQISEMEDSVMKVTAIREKQKQCKEMRTVYKNL